MHAWGSQERKRGEWLILPVNEESGNEFKQQAELLVSPEPGGMVIRKRATCLHLPGV